MLILGGGDGGLLKCLLTLKDPPNHITLVEIDEDVMRACSQHVPSICEPFLSQREGSNFKVVTGDCFQYLENAKVRRHCCSNVKLSWCENFIFLGLWNEI